MAILIVAEKPSVARDIAAALKGMPGDIRVTNAIGHLVTLAAPETEDKWALADLPLFPDFRLEALPKTKSQLVEVGKAMRAAEVTEVVNACDAGREGELIFSLIAEYHKLKKATTRMWLQTMTATGIREAFQGRLPAKEYQGLNDAAHSRNEADWLVGVNGSRVMFNLGYGPVGRVQTPTLAMVVLRETEILRFVPKDYWEVRAVFSAQAGDYKGTWCDPAFKPDPSNPDAEKKRLWSREAAERIAQAVKAAARADRVSEELKPRTVEPKPLFDLTTLQREANSKLGFSAKKTLGLAQSLYETHKATTYPRTDARALPEDYVQTAEDVLAALSGEFAQHGRRVLEQGWVKGVGKKVFNNAKISDHFAIIPTTTSPSGLSADESRLYQMIARRFLAVFHPAAHFMDTTRITEAAGHQFESKGSVLVEPGWMAVYGKEEQGSEDALPAVTGGEKPAVREVESVGCQTRPPARYTEATLLGAMETAGRQVEDAEESAAMKERGLGTPATRAAIIEGLLQPGKTREAYLSRQGKSLVPSALAMKMISKLHEMGVKHLTQPDLTGKWEASLKQMESGKITRDAFMAKVRELTALIATAGKAAATSSGIALDGSTRSSAGKAMRKTSISCPVCSEHTLNSDGRVLSCACGFKVWQEVCGTPIADADMAKVMGGQEIGPYSFKTTKDGKPKTFTAALKFEGGKLQFSFAAARQTDLRCPKCHDPLHADDRAVRCKKDGCGFGLWLTVAGAKLSLSHIADLLDGETIGPFDMVSKDHKKFSASLRFNGEKVEFVFDDRGESRPPASELKDAACPECGKPIMVKPARNGVAYACAQGCGFSMYGTVSNRPMTEPEARILLKGGRTATLSGFKSAKNKPFKASMSLEPGGKGKVALSFD